MTIYIILTLAGTDTGPFDLYSNATSYLFDGPPFKTGVSRASLVAGYTTTAPIGTTQVKIQSTGICTGHVIIDLDLDTSTTTTTTTGEPCECYVGYVVTPEGDQCVKTETTEATPPTDLQTSVAKTYGNYSNYGSILFDLGYNLDGTTSAGYTIITTALWKNIAGNLVDGPLNRCGLWSTTYTNNQDVGFTQCINVAVAKTYYIAVGCDNYAIIRIDGTTIVEQDVTALTAQFGAGPSVSFKYWFIYPVELSAGSHVIEMIGHNVTSIAALGAEIYDATSAEILAATDYTTFYNDHILFTTRDMIGESIQIGSGGYGWECPTGYSLIMCDGDPYCTNISYIACGEVPVTTSTTTTEGVAPPD